MYTESQLNPQFLAKHHGNRQHDMTASRTPPSHREDSHENLRSPLGSCNAHATTLAEPSSMRWAATTQEDLRCRRAAPRRPSGAATAQPRAADRRAALRYPSRGVARNAARGAATSPKTQKARRVISLACLFAFGAQGDPRGDVLRGRPRRTSPYRMRRGARTRSLVRALSALSRLVCCIGPNYASCAETTLSYIY